MICLKCNDKVEPLLGIKCDCGLCITHCEELCIDDSCDCLENLMNVRLDSEFEDETEMQIYSTTKGKVVLTEHTKPYVSE